jgi:rubrerythrin
MNRTKIKETLKHLRAALSEELKGANFYIKSEEVAKKEGFSEAAEFFRNAAKDKKKRVAEIETILYQLRD